MGTDYEVGYQYGYLLKNGLKSFNEVFETLKEGFLDKEISYLPWYTRVFANIFGSMVFNHKINGYVGKLTTDVLEQIKGVSEGFGLSDSFLSSCMYSMICIQLVVKLL
jgi:hypothetical protein